MNNTDKKADEIEKVVIVINPGSTSTKFAVWTRRHSVGEGVVRHDGSDIPENVPDQLEMRMFAIDGRLIPLLDGRKVVAAVGRGGLLKPLTGGTYLVNQRMIDDLKSGTSGNHASNLGAIIAYKYAERYRVDAYVVDPVTVDEFHDPARISGVSWITRKSRSHALNIKAVVRRAATKLDKALADSRFVVAHLGGGFSIAAVRGGRIIDVNDALLGMGPYSPERAGALPIGPLVERCFSGGVSREELLAELSHHSGLAGYCGTSDTREVLKRRAEGDEAAAFAIDGMIYQIAKEIGAMAAVLEGRLDAVVITGGLAHSAELMTQLKPYVAFFGPFVVYPGEVEMQALAEGAFRVLDHDEPVLEYH